MELLPGPVVAATTIMTAARRYAAQAGTPGVVFSGAGHRQRDPVSAPVRDLPMDRTIGCDERLIDETPAVIGFSHLQGGAPGRISGRAIGPNRQSFDLRLRVARSVVPGLTVVAPARGLAFAAGIYRFTLDGDQGRTVVDICLRTSPFSG
ncbi:hypothetical protein BH20CHL7_BH20CHL7_16450 [soil metagenome]